MRKSSTAIDEGSEVVAAAAAAKKIPTPFGLPRILLIIAYSIAICLTGMAVGAADPLRQMLLLNGALDHLEVIEERETLLASVVGLGVSFTVLSGIIVGPLIDLFGSKIVAVVGILLHAAGYIFFFFIGTRLWLLYVGAAAFGLAFQCIINSHLCAGCLYPSQANLIVGIIGAAPDLSYLIPASLLSYAASLDAPYPVQTAVMRYLLVVVVPALLVCALLVPWRPFQIPLSGSRAAPSRDLASIESGGGTDGTISERTALVSQPRPKVPYEDYQIERERLSSSDRSIEEQPQAAVASQVLRLSLLSKPGGRDSLRRKEDGTFAGGPFWHLPVGAQLRTADYWLFVPVFLFTFLRRKHYVLFLRDTLEEMATGPEQLDQVGSLMTMYNFLVPYGFITAILWGWLVDVSGFSSVLFGSLLFGTLNSSLLTMAKLPLHYVTIILKIIQHSFVMGLCMAFCVTYYGLNTISTLQGVATFIVGVIAIALDFVWPPFVKQTINSFRIANLILLGLSIVILVFPITLLVRQRRRLAAAKK